MRISHTLLPSLWTLLLIQCSSPEPTHPPVFLAQGTMAGEVTDQQAILQTRTTSVGELTDGHVPGTTAWVHFRYGTNPTLDENAPTTDWQQTRAENDFIAKSLLTNLEPGTTYYYQALYGNDTLNIQTSQTGTFNTNPGPGREDPVSMVVVTGMNYYHFHYGRYDSTLRYQGADKALGYPALEAIRELEPDYFIGTGDNVYFDHPSEGDYQRAIERGLHPLPGLFDGKAVIDEAGMRRKYHVQFVQPRYKQLFRQLGTYWLKDDHDYRINDSDPYIDFPISHELGIKNFREQLPVTFPPHGDQPTYRTLRLSKDLQIWMVEGRDYRSANDMEDGPDKTLWGTEQLDWLKRTLLESTATFKILVSPTPLVGPDDAYKRDNHVNHEGFRHEGDAFFSWLTEHGFDRQHFYIVCGDRHWQYHAVHPSGIQEFSTGALVDANSRAGRIAGDPQSTDPDSLVQQFYIQGTPEQASGGFLLVNTSSRQDSATIQFSFFDETGEQLHQHSVGTGQTGQ